MKIAITDTTSHVSEIGGGHLIVPKLISGLRSRGHDVHFIGSKTLNPILLEKVLLSGAPIHTNIWSTVALVNDSTPIFADWLNDFDPDLYVISTSGDLGWTVLPRLNSQMGTIMIGHTDSETYYDPLRHYEQFITRAVGVSREICRNYNESCNVPAERIDWIPYGVEIRTSNPEEFNGPLRLIYVGRVEEGQKRISDIVKLIRRLSAEGLDYVFTVVGDGDKMPMVRSALADEVDTGRVRLTGWLEGSAVLQEMNFSDVFILASAYEGFCISLTEAMASGCCPIVTDIRSGNKQLVRHSENGFVVPIGDVDEFVDRIKYLANERGRLAEMRRRAWETGKEYGIERMVNSYEKCFERAILDARANRRRPKPSFPLMASCRSKYPLWLRRIKAKVKDRLATN